MFKVISLSNPNLLHLIQSVPAGNFREHVNHCMTKAKKLLLLAHLAFFSDLSKHLVVDYHDIKELMDKGNALR